MANWVVTQKSLVDKYIRFGSESYIDPEKKFINFQTISDCFDVIKDAIKPYKTNTNALVYDLDNALNNFLDGGEAITSLSQLGCSRYIAQKGDVIISRLRPYLKEVAYIYSEANLMLVSTEFVILRKKSDSVYDAEILFCLLLTESSQKILCANQQGTNHPRVPIDIILNIKLPNISSQLSAICKQLIKNANEQYYMSISSYNKALFLLEDEISFKIKLKCSLKKWIIHITKTQQTGRFDPEFWHPKFELLKQHFLGKGALEYTNNLLIYNSRGLQPDYINDGEILVVNSQHLGSHHVDIDSLERTNQEFWNSNPKSRIYKNDILLYTTGAYLGRTNVWLEDKKAIASNHVNILRVDESKCNPVYIAFFLNSEYGVMQSKRWQSGSGQQEIYPNDIGQMMIYLPSKDVQDEIAECVIKSYHQLRESKRLLEIAKKAVEIAIEESEEKAMQYLNENQATSIEY